MSIDNHNEGTQDRLIFSYVTPLLLCKLIGSCSPIPHFAFGRYLSRALFPQMSGLMLNYLSYFLEHCVASDRPQFLWGERWNSNPHKPDSQSGALPLSYSRHILVESPGVEPSYLDFQSSAPTAYANFPYVLGGNFIERYVAASLRSTTKGKRRFRAYYLSRISIRLSLKHRRVSNHFDTVLTFKLGISCIPLPWAGLLLF